MNPANQTYLEKHVTRELPPSRPNHGGDILEFSKHTGLDLEDCIDLSTGIAPWPYPVLEIPKNILQALPSSTPYEQELIRSASNYYGCDAQTILPVAGSQAAIETIPRLAQPDARVAYPSLGYQEHWFSWQKAGAQTIKYTNQKELDRLVADSIVDHAVVINPNNPTAESYHPEWLEQTRASLASRGGFLVVDEAFADPNPAHSLAASAGKPGLIVLRSTGKFFGLAGLRLGFVCGSPRLIQKLKAQMGLWQVSTLALWLGTKMLSDVTWIESQKARCADYSEKLHRIASEKFPNLSWKKSSLFVVGQGSVQQVTDDRAQLAGIGIHSRFVPAGDSNALLRLGLAEDEILKTINKLL